MARTDASDVGEVNAPLVTYWMRNVSPLPGAAGSACADASPLERPKATNVARPNPFVSTLTS